MALRSTYTREVISANILERENTFYGGTTP